MCTHYLRIEDLFAGLKVGQEFTKLDVAHAYLQNPFRFPKLRYPRSMWPSHTHRGLLSIPNEVFPENDCLSYKVHSESGQHPVASLFAFAQRQALEVGRGRDSHILRRPGAHSHQLYSWPATHLHMGLVQSSPIHQKMECNTGQLLLQATPWLQQKETIPSWREKVWHLCMEWSDSTSFSTAGHLLSYQTTNHWKASFTVRSSVIHGSCSNSEMDPPYWVVYKPGPSIPHADCLF